MLALPIMDAIVAQLGESKKQVEEVLALIATIDSKADPQPANLHYRAIMMAEPQLTRAALARRLGVSRAWITRVLGSIRPGE